MAVAIKFAALVLKTVSKPLATFIKAQAQNHPKFRSLCIRFAQFTHRHEQMLNVRLIGHQIVSIKPLTEERAIQAGTELFGEIVLFSLAGVLLLEEAVRKKVTDDASKAARAEEKAALEQRIQALERRHHQEHASFQQRAEQGLRAAEEELVRLQIQQCLMRDQIAGLHDRLAELSPKTDRSPSSSSPSSTPLRANRATCLLSSSSSSSILSSPSSDSCTLPSVSPLSLSPAPLSAQQISAELDQVLTPEWKERLTRRRSTDADAKL